MPLAITDPSDQIALGQERRSPHLRIHAVNVFVRNQDESLRFYLDVLGFSLAGDVRFGSGERWVAVSPPDGSAVLSLVMPKADSKEQELIGRPTNIVFVTEDVVGKFAEWRKKGVRFQYSPRLKRVKYERQSGVEAARQRSVQADSSSLWGGVITHFKDPDGNSFALVSFDEETRAVEAQRRELAAKLEAERRAAQEMEIAREVQLRLFPQTVPSLGTLDYCGRCIQARQVGGDYYDFLDLGRGRLGLVVGDISGKGIAAALLMANLQASLRSHCATALEQSGRFLQTVNRLFYENSTESAYATLFFAEYDGETRRLRYTNCGHLCALLLRTDGCIEKLDSTSTVLGLFKEWDCVTDERVLESGDTVALYTDGITESFNDHGEEFGERRLVESLRSHQQESAAALVDSIFEDVRQFSRREQHDDMTLIAAKCL
jgi:serine phosphatase RsbU (regulator of sigma subunit)/catechol 2,3-dioxygenase-like lactoylglutathione lyase family enzyme